MQADTEALLGLMNGVGVCVRVMLCSLPRSKDLRAAGRQDGDAQASLLTRRSCQAFLMLPSSSLLRSDGEDHRVLTSRCIRRCVRPLQTRYCVHGGRLPSFLPEALRRGLCYHGSRCKERNTEEVRNLPRSPVRAVRLAPERMLTAHHPAEPGWRGGKLRRGDSGPSGAG